MREWPSPTSPLETWSTRSGGLQCGEWDWGGCGVTVTILILPQATLCSRRGCMEAIVAQLGSDSEELHQVGAGAPRGGGTGMGTVPTFTHSAVPPQVVSSILRNLSWRADINSKKVLREVGSVTGLTRCALRAGKVSSAAGGRTDGRTRGGQTGG